MRFINFLAPFIFGLVGILSFAPFSIKFLIFISYSYLIYILISDQKNDLFKIFIWGIGHWGFGMSWIIVSVYYYGETAIALTFLIYVLLVCILSIVFTCPIILIKKLLNLINIKNNIYKTILISSFLMLSELSRYYLLNGVPWLIPGNIYLDTVTQNIYPLLGVSGASILIYLISSNLVIFYKQSRIFYIIIFLLVISIVPSHKIENVSDGIKVSIIQPSSDPFLKYKTDYYYEIEQNLLNLIQKTAKDTQLIVLPEAELPYALDNPRFDSFINNVPQSERIVMGLWSIEENELYNSIYSVKNRDLYKKIHLVPFGEYIPFIESLRGLISFFNLPMSNVSRGKKNQNNLHILSDMKVATPICFDITFQETIRKMNKNSLLMINISNDTWFGNSIGPHHHLEITRIRSIENNRWTVRATNDGFSAFISNKGTVVSLLEKGESNILESNVSLIKENSFFNKIGYLFAYIFTFLFITLYLLVLIWTKFIKK